MRLNQESDFIEIAKNSPITKLAEQLGYDLEQWIEYSTVPLPETIRVNPIHQDCNWTISKLEELGGKRIKWIGAKTLGFQMPWIKGGAEQDDIRKLLQSMHNSGRHTRQEAVSMIPAELIDPKPGERILDSCAAPGSKATQLAELAKDDAAIIANEPNKGRMNMLVTNRSRLGLRSIAITQHDARNFPRVPQPGFDAVLVDVPCSGTGTIRKNKGLWWKWKPSISKSLHKLQLKISERCASLLKPEGRMIYSTCSIDPLENEIIVAKLLEKYDWLELERINVEEKLIGAKYDYGIDDLEPFIDEKTFEKFPTEKSISQLKNCIRINPSQNDSGGFFIAMFRQIEESENARALEYRDNWPLGTRDSPREDHGAPIPITKNRLGELKNEWGEWEGFEGKLWERGRTIIEASNALSEGFFEPARIDGLGNQLPGNHWHPLKVRQLGRVAFKDSNSQGLRPKAELLRGHFSFPKKHIFKIENNLLFRLLDEGVIPIEELNDEIKNERSGAILLDINWISGRRLLPAWLGTGLRLLLDENEKLILNTQREDFN
ncbi:MAG TPA: RsmB/NOP family class I SAM-dependent RNA methyltransferase [Candidatus Poseidoniaceae archaeon]|nr:RsmB/NOP family class I SAM-dependent RNA methyltransferase [Candidatus Poseidoniaceae archaeon]